MKLEFSGQIFEKYSNINFHENPSSGSRIIPCWRKDRHDEANSRFSQFYERAQKSAQSQEFIIVRLQPETMQPYTQNPDRVR